MDSPSYFAVIPSNVRYAKIPPNAKLLYGEITALANKHGYCFASNLYFSRLYEVNSKTVSGWVATLLSCGFISVEIDKLMGNKRKIWLSDPIPKKMDSYPEKDGYPYPEKPDHNNTSINNKLNSKESMKNVSRDRIPSKGRFPTSSQGSGDYSKQSAVANSVLAKRMRERGMASQNARLFSQDGDETGYGGTLAPLETS